MFILSGGPIAFVNWYIHLLDFMHNEILELSILCVIAGVVDALIYTVGYKLEQKKNLD